jgi:DNA-directed RNA polymerase specialized sigma24 family protein
MRDERVDAELLSSGVASDFGCLYDRHVRAVTAFVGSWIGEPDVVFDLVAETFARALEHRLQYDASKGPAVAWLLGIARNLMIDSARRGQVESESRERLGMGRVELDDEAVEREAVIRRVVLEESYRAIAADLRCSEQVVRKRVSRGLARLRESLEGR